VTPNDDLLRRLCDLAALDLDASATRRLEVKLARVVAYVERLAALDLPAPEEEEAPAAVWREDVVGPPFEVGPLLDEASHVVDGWFTAPPPGTP
jgi:aspartyl/glutamyl-tRNA(Asn/Gln) amidotransferase C subunit